jgi:hypothetical protein
MSVPLTKGWTIESIREAAFDGGESIGFDKGWFYLLVNVKPIQPFDDKDLYQEYQRLLSRFCYGDEPYKMCGRDFIINNLSIPWHYGCLTVGLKSINPIDYDNVELIIGKLLSMAEYKTTPSFTVSSYYDDFPKPWYKRIFDWFL